MIERVHEHLTGELRQNARTDTIFVLTAIALSLVVLAVNSSFASEEGGVESTVVMFVLITFQVVVIAAVIFGLLKGKRMRLVILGGLLQMYKDNGVEAYYDESLLKSYSTRYHIFIAVVVLLGVVSIVVPLIVNYM